MRSVLANFLQCRRRKTDHKSVCRHFLDNFFQRTVFFSACSSPFILVYNGAEGTLEKFWGLNKINGYLKISQREDLLGRQGGGMNGFLKKARLPPPPPILSTQFLIIFFVRVNLKFWHPILRDRLCSYKNAWFLRVITRIRIWKQSWENPFFVLIKSSSTFLRKKSHRSSTSIGPSINA